MKYTSCPGCGRKIGIGVFLGAITGGKSHPSCAHCGAVVEPDLSLFRGLFYAGFAPVLVPVTIIFASARAFSGLARAH